MGEKEVLPAPRAQATPVNLLLPDAARYHLQHSNLRKVKIDFAVFRYQSMCVFNLLSFHGSDDVIPHLVAARTDARSDGGDKIPRPRRKGILHRLNTATANALRKAPPAGVENAGGTVFGVPQEDRRTVSNQYSQTQSRTAGDHSISIDGRFATCAPPLIPALNDTDVDSVHLPGYKKPIGAQFQGSRKTRTILRDPINTVTNRT